MQSTRVAILGVDVGGTFTDAVLLEDGRVRTAKVPTARRQEESVLAAAAAVGARDVERFAHGTTVATNALLERRGARTAFVATAGFEHLLHLRRQTRAHLYRLCDEHPEPLVPLERSFGERGAHPAILLVSGPAGGGVEAGVVARLAGFDDAIAFDMGGTSTDVCLLPGGEAERVGVRVVVGLLIRLPTLDLHTVGAGGGSL